MTASADPAARVTVVIPAYGRPDLLLLAVRSTLQQDLPPADYEVVVVDSTPDDSNLRALAPLVAEAGGRLTVLTKRAEGPGPSRNMGARHGSGAVIAFIDSDCQASPGWLRAGLAAFGPGVGLVQGRTIPDPAVPMRSLSRSVRVEQETPVYETANMFYRRDAFEQGGGFPPDMSPDTLHPLGGEDTDLAWAVKRRGWASRFCAEALVEHAVLPITPLQWLINRQCFIFPRLVGRHPELRAFFYARYFYDDVQAYLVLGLAGCLLALWQSPALLLWLPYAGRRASDTTRAGGPLRLLRPLLYLPRDLCALALLCAGSLRFRSLLL